MLSISYKAKQFLILLAKLLIVSGAFYFIYKQLTTNDQLDWDQFVTLLLHKNSSEIIIILLVLTFLNRFLEILKWQNLVSFIASISVAKATQQVLGALTFSIFTPNGIGEYAAKALFYDKKETRTIVFLNLIGNGIQVIVSIFFGIISLLLFSFYFPKESRFILLLLSIFFVLCIFVFSFKKITIRGYSINLLFQKTNEIPKKIHRKNLLLSTMRFLILMHQYYFLFLFFDINLPYLLIMVTIISVYLLGSALPTFQFLDFAVKGSVAVYFFGLLGVNEWITIFITTLIWFLNVVLPVIIGSYYVLSFKMKKSG